jgi:hypothetical protein
MASGPGQEFDFRLTMKRNGMYPQGGAGVNFDVNRGKVWIFLDEEPRQALCIEAPRLRQLIARYDEALAESGLPPVTEDGYGR